MTPREELYKLVWSQPMRTLAKSRGISDVALAKQCRQANVPVPPRGWWARKEAGQAATVAPLPPLPFVMNNFFPAIANQVSDLSDYAQPQSGHGDRPALPVFRDIAAVRGEIETAVSMIKVPTVLTKPHPIVARLLKQDDERKSKQSTNGYVSDYYGPKFVKPIQQRRLHILSCIMVELERLGCKAHGSTHAGERFSIAVSNRWAYILFGIEGGTQGTYFYRDRSRAGRADGERLRFDLTGHDPDRTPPIRTWRDDGTPLERQVTDIVCGILLSVEEEARKWALWRHKSDLEERARRSREAQLAVEKAETDRIAREAAAAAARIARLIDGSDLLERAARIRRYVASVRAANATMPEPAPICSLDAWTEWALLQADNIDPVVSGRFLGDLDR